MPRLAKIAVYPIKSFDPVWLETAPLTSAGRLANDRAYVLVKSDGRYINGKETPAVHTIRTIFDLAQHTVELSRVAPSPLPLGAGTHRPTGPEGCTERAQRDRGEGCRSKFHLLNDREKLESWFSEALNQPVTLKHDPLRGFFDDEEAFGPTIISTATIETVAAWFPELEVGQTFLSGIHEVGQTFLSAADQIRLRFRSNLEIDGVPAFWEDQLYTRAGEIRKFRIGEVEFQGTNPCARCSVPKRNPLTGDPLNDFQRIFMEQRKAMLPEWAEETRFDHYYRLAVNTRVSLSQKPQFLNIFESLVV